MKRIVLVVLGLALSGCGAFPAASPAAESNAATPVVVIQTVLVTVVPSDAPAQAPTQPPATGAPPQVVVVTATPEALTTGSTSVPTVRPSDATAPLPADPGGGIFTNLTRSGDQFSLRCQPDAISFGVSTDNPYVVGVDIYYRIQDRLSVSISNWQFGGSMESDKHGNFTMAFPASHVDPDVRSHRAWFDYQFVGSQQDRRCGWPKRKDLQAGYLHHRLLGLSSR